LREKCLPPEKMSDEMSKARSYEDYLPPLVNFLNLPPRPRPEAPGGPPGAIVVRAKVEEFVGCAREVFVFRVA
jgi:hypothetical protein